MTAVFGRRQRVINDKLGHRRRLKYGLSARLIGARRLPIGLSMVARRPVDFLAILSASVASIVISPPFSSWRSARRRTAIFPALSRGD